VYVCRQMEEIRQHQRTWKHHVTHNACSLHGQGSLLALLLNFCLLYYTKHSFVWSWVTYSTLTSGSQSNFATGLNYILIEVSLYQPHQVDCLRVFFWVRTLLFFFNPGNRPKSNSEYLHRNASVYYTCCYIYQSKI
jgi:hypothetical protein